MWPQERPLRYGFCEKFDSLAARGDLVTSASDIGIKYSIYLAEQTRMPVFITVDGTD